MKAKIKVSLNAEVTKYKPSAVRDYVQKQLGLRISRAKHRGDSFDFPDGSSAKVTYYNSGVKYSTINIRGDKSAIKQLAPQVLEVVKKAAKLSGYKYTTQDKVPVSMLKIPHISAKLGEGLNITITSGY